jgi:hypothetical protein
MSLRNKRFPKMQELLDRNLCPSDKNCPLWGQKVLQWACESSPGWRKEREERPIYPAIARPFRGLAGCPDGAFFLAQIMQKPHSNPF